MSRERRFTGRQLTIIVAAICIAVVGAPVGVMAVTTGSTVNIVDPTTATNIAKVDAGGHLLVGAGNTVVVGSTTDHGLTAGSDLYPGPYTVSQYRQIRVVVTCTGCTSAAR